MTVSVFFHAVCQRVCILPALFTVCFSSSRSLFPYLRTSLFRFFSFHLFPTYIVYIFLLFFHNCSLFFTFRSVCWTLLLAVSLFGSVCLFLSLSVGLSLSDYYSLSLYLFVCKFVSVSVCLSILSSGRLLMLITPVLHHHHLAAAAGLPSPIIALGWTGGG